MRKAAKRTAGGQSDRVQFVVDVRLVIGKLRREVDQLTRQQPTGAAEDAEEHRHDDQNSRDPSDPAFNVADQRCEQEGQHRRKRERNKQLASDVKNRDDERRQQNHPDSYERRGRGILRRSHGTSSVVHSAASSKCAARRPRAAVQFFEAKKVSSDPVAIQKEGQTADGTSHAHAVYAS